VVEEAARKARVAFDLTYVTSDHPYAAIIEAAKQKGCDLIVMASHGRRGPKAVLLGSETQKVLTHSQIPVLVYR
jgi:nucleotide-binding universal stress UspA family protein